MEGAGGNDIAGIEPDESSQPSDLIGNLMRHRAGIVVLPGLAVGP